MEEVTYSIFSNFEYAVMKEGSIDVRVTNNLTAPVSGINVNLYNTVDHTPIGTGGTIALIDPGQAGLISIDLADVTIRNSLTAAVSLGSPGSATPVPIDLDVNKVEVSIDGRNLLVKSGRVVVPTQNISFLGERECRYHHFRSGKRC